MPSARSPDHTDDTVRLISVTDVADALSISRQQVYRMLDKRVIDSCYLGTRRVVKLSDLKAYVASLPRERQTTY